MVKLSILLGLVLTNTVLLTAGAKILVLLPIGTKSHKNVFIPLMEELSRRGHEITQVTLFKSADKLKGMTTIYLERSNQLFEALSPKVANHSSPSLGTLVEMVTSLREGCDVFYNDSLTQEFMARRESYDVTLVSSFANECYMPLAHDIGAPIVMVSPASLFTNVAWDLNVPAPWSYVPFILTPYNSKMSFSQRVKNTLANIAWFAARRFVIGPAMDSVARKYIPNAVSGLDSSNVSLVLVNSHFSMNDPRPAMPYVIDVGGMHCREAEKLPEDFESFVNSSGRHGFIVFSMGSVLQSQFMPEYFVEAFKTAFGQLEQRVVWKYESVLDGLPSNVMTSKWIPQQDLMGHPKCRLAITHGGLLSLQEVAYHGVPLLGVPYGADRDGNINQAIEQGFAQLVDYATLNASIVYDKIKSMLDNGSYKEKAAEISALMKDRLEHPAETGAYWIEHVIRHKGAKHLQSSAVHLNFFQYFLVDVILFFCTVLIIVLVAIVLVVKKIVNYLNRLRTKKNVRKLKTK